MNLRLIRQICTWWTTRASDRRLARALPGVAERKRKFASLRSNHKSTKSLIAEQREDIHAALGLRRTK